jgi:3-carboxy-cis,cis-muconate cycloisomerase
MPASPLDSRIYAGLFGDAEVAALFTDSAELRAMLLVEGTLARVQGDLGLIPRDAAAFIDRAAREVQIDPTALADSVAVNGVPVPGLLAAFRKAAEAPEPMRWLHWGATSQDIVDTALALRLRRVLALWDARLDALIGCLGKLAADHADLPMAARTYGQAAVPTTFGAQVASWGRPLLRHRKRLDAIRPEVLKVSLSGAAGTLSAMERGPEVRAALARALDMQDPGASWHSERDGIAALAGWCAGLLATLAKLGEDLLLLTQTGIAEVRISGAGGSSTMPQKQNPVGPSVLLSLARHGQGLASTLTAAGAHRQARDGAAWFTEWLTLPQLAQVTARAVALGEDIASRLSPSAEDMARGLSADGGAIHAEALTFALAARLPRAEAEAEIKRLLAAGGDLRAAFAAAFPDLQLPPVLVGEAPTEARAFAAEAQYGRPV